MPNLLPLKKVNNFSLSFLILFFISISVCSQNIDVKGDLLLVDSLAKQQIPISTKRAYVYKDQAITLKNSNPLSLVFGGSLYIYQNFFSQHLSANCIYHPSCSDFSKQSVLEFGFIKGALLSLDRLSRCNRIAATDLNPEDLDKEKLRFNDSVDLYK